MTKMEPTYGEASARSERCRVRGTSRLAIFPSRKAGAPAVRWIRSSDGVYRPAPMAWASPAAVAMVACRGKTFSSSTRCASSSPSEQQSPTTSSL
jgi:hypothetical protein